MFSTTNPTVLRISKIISDVFNPLTAFVVYFIYYSSLNLAWKEAFTHFLPMILIMIVPVIIWIFWNVKKGKYSNADVSDRNQRKSLYFFVAGVLFLYWLYDWFFKQHVDYRILFVLILLILMQISNYFIKSSMHTAFNILVSAFLFVLNPFFGCIWFLLSVIVGITRILLKRHTPKEVLAGGFIALLVSVIYIFVYIGMNFQG